MMPKDISDIRDVLIEKSWTDVFKETPAGQLWVIPDNSMEEEIHIYLSSSPAHTFKSICTGKETKVTFPFINEYVRPCIAQIGIEFYLDQQLYRIKEVTYKGGSYLLKIEALVVMSTAATSSTISGFLTSGFGINKDSINYQLFLDKATFK
jgi:hypothetical protein